MIIAILISFALISLVTLKSIAPELAGVQLIFWILSLGVFIGASRVRLNLVKRFHWLSYVALIVLLVYVLASNVVIRGAANWISVAGLFSIQPSQLAIPLVGFSLALYAATHKLDQLKHLLVFSLIAIIPTVLIIIAPDIGTALIFIISIGAIVFFSEIKDKYLLGMLMTVVLVSVIAWMLVLKPYQKARITSFINSHASQGQDSANYNAYQSQIAVGSGMLLGKGLGHGSQSHLRFLPERQTDFIFASFTEEWGFLGSVMILSLYFFLVVYFLINIMRAENKFTAYYLIATVTMITVQTFINVGMNIGLLPITGVTLPLVSYGGSSLISICLMLGLAQNMINSKQQKVKLDFK